MPLSTPTRLHHAVDRLLLEHGAYAPLELVLLMDRLADADHRAWRLAQVSSLDGYLARGLESLRELLDDAADRARRLGLEPAIETYYGWEGAAGKALRCSTDSTLDELLRTVYRRPSDSATQLDLFIDTAKTVARNELGDALLAHDVRRARARLVRVLELEAEHSLTLEAKRLIAALQSPEPADAADARDQLMLIEREWQPAAERVLGVRSRDFLAPLWRRAARKLESRPSTVSSHATMRAGRTGRASTGTPCGAAFSPLMITARIPFFWRASPKRSATSGSGRQPSNTGANSAGELPRSLKRSSSP